jgi:hypothetical protein
MNNPIKHTPGPWRAGKPQWKRGTGPYKIPISSASGTIGNVLTHESIQWYPPEQCDPQPNADAKLIAAAPDMLRIIRTVYDGIHRGVGPMAGASDGEIGDIINDEMCGLLGNDWNK